MLPSPSGRGAGGEGVGLPPGAGQTPALRRCAQAGWSAWADLCNARVRLAVRFCTGHIPVPHGKPRAVKEKICMGKCRGGGSQLGRPRLRGGRDLARTSESAEFCPPSGSELMNKTTAGEATCTARTKPKRKRECEFVGGRAIRSHSGGWRAATMCCEARPYMRRAGFSCVGMISHGTLNT